MAHSGSGSTIFGNVLGSVEDFFHPGELRTLWDEGLCGLQACGCGKQVTDCPVWSSVVTTGFGESADPEAFARWRAEAVRVRHTTRLLREHPGRATGWPALDASIRITDRLYRAVAHVTKARIVVDTSKRAGDAALLRLLPNVDGCFVHLVRDPRAVSHGWRRRNPDNGLVRAAAEWSAFSALHEAIRRRAPRARSIRIRYEDFVACPEAALRAVTALVGQDPATLPLADQRTAQLPLNHTMSGNWTRFGSGRVELREDRAWQRDLSAAERASVVAATWPLMLRYGYPLPPVEPGG
jgi:hypothetical protein